MSSAATVSDGGTRTRCGSSTARSRAAASWWPRRPRWRRWSATRRQRHVDEVERAWRRRRDPGAARAAVGPRARLLPADRLRGHLARTRREHGDLWRRALRPVDLGSRRRGGARGRFRHRRGPARSRSCRESFKDAGPRPADRDRAPGRRCGGGPGGARWRAISCSPVWTVHTEVTGRSLKACLKWSGKMAASIAVILGETELADGVAVIRDLDRGEQETVALEDVVARVAELLQPKVSDSGG